MTFRQFLLVAFLAIMPSMLSAKSDIPTLADEFASYQSYTLTSDVERILRLLDGETIRFSDFSPSAEISMFKYEVPDTVWIKERPKKNPKEGKHYELRNMYRGQIKKSYYTTTEYTPPIEMAGALFKVLSVEPVASTSYYSTRKTYKVHLQNVATGELLYWEVPESTIGHKYNVHLTNLSDNLGLKGRTLYSAYNDRYSSSSKFTNITKYRCTDSDAYLDFSGISPQLKISFSTVDERNNSADHLLKIGYTSSYSSDLQWYDEAQITAINDADKVYEIDYIVRLNAPTVNFPFSFKTILGAINDIYSTQVGQKISPSRYGGSSDDLTPSDYVREGDTFFIGDRITVRGKDYYKGVLDGKAFYIPATKVKLSQEGKMKLDSLINSPQEVRDAFFEFAKALSYYGHYTKLDKAIKTVQGFAAKGISIPSLGVYDMSEYTDGTGIRFTFHNPTNKTIKYVNIGFVGYNAVDDRVGRTISKRCIGPIEPGETASYDFEYAWFTDVVDYAKMTSLSVQYKDGTTKVVAKPSSVVWSDDVHNGLSSRLDSLKSELADSEE